MDLSKLLQQSVNDEGECVVHLSQPHLFRVGGVIDHVGVEIVQELGLMTMPCGRKRTGTAAAQPRSAKRSRTTADDVEPSDSSSGSDGEVSDDSYRRKKQMSASIFRYFMQADASKQANMQVDVCPQLQQTWQRLIAHDPKVKLDDLGDALLHALGDVLCGATKYRQLVPSSISLHNNRTVVVTVCRDYTYWAVIHCTWNTFELEDIGFDFTTLSSLYFKSQQTVADIKQTLLSHLQTAMTDPAGGDLYRPVDVIQFVCKQLKAFQDFTAKQAGVLTHSTLLALQGICDEAAGADSRLCQLNDKTQGAMYIRTQPLTGRKFQVVSSTGKLTNATLACLHWMHANATQFVDKRQAFMDENTKLRFFLHLQSVAESQENRLESIILSPRCIAKFVGEELRSVDESIKRVLAYVVLIGINKNEQRVKAVAANYRRPVSKSKTATVSGTSQQSMQAAVDVEPVPNTSSSQQR